MRELREWLEKTEHRAEILIAISHNRRQSGYYELAENYMAQGRNTKAKVGSIRKLLMGLIR